jgi:hypothetical protein
MTEESPEPSGKRRGKKLMIWVIAVIVALPVLFYLFELVVPKYLPSNF